MNKMPQSSDPITLEGARAVCAQKAATGDIENQLIAMWRLLVKKGVIRSDEVFPACQEALEVLATGMAQLGKGQTWAQLSARSMVGMVDPTAVEAVVGNYITTGEIREATQQELDFRRASRTSAVEALANTELKADDGDGSLS